MRQCRTSALESVRTSVGEDRLDELRGGVEDVLPLVSLADRFGPDELVGDEEVDALRDRTRPEDEDETERQLARLRFLGGLGFFATNV